MRLIKPRLLAVLSLLFSLAVTTKHTLLSNATTDHTIHLPLVMLGCNQPICGFVTINKGRVCCIGGPAGTTVSIPVRFDAFSRAGTITHMRVDRGECFDQAPLTTNWQPFVSSITYTATLNGGWSIFDVRAQYQDSLGHVSPIFCGDLTLEGMNPTPTR